MNKFCILLSTIFLSVGYAKIIDPIPENIRLPGNNTGISLMLSETGLSYLKSAYIPYLYKKFSNIRIPDQSFSKSILTFYLKNIIVKIPEPDSQ